MSLPRGPQMSMNTHTTAQTGLNLAQGGILEYASIWYNCCSSMRDADKAEADMGSKLRECGERIRARTFQQVRASALAGNAADILEMGIRLFTGCSTEKNDTEALVWWLRMADATLPGHIPNVPRSLRARAFSCLAHAQWEARIANGGQTWNIDSVHRACVFANECAALGLSTPEVLAVAAGTERAGFRRREDARYGPTENPERFEKLTDLWEALDKRKEEVERQDAKRAEKAVENPNAYVCAATGCGIEATRKSGLMRCAGPCAPEIKPAYCSKECQRKDWKRHKPACKPTQDLGKDAAPEPSHADAAVDELAPAKAGEAARFKTDGKEHSVMMPDPLNEGQSVRMSSTTMSTSFMRDVREAAEKIISDSQDARPSADVD